MRKALAMSALVAGLSFAPLTMAAAQTSTTDDPNDVQSINNPVDENDDSGFDDWGLFGLLGLLGLAGLARKKRHEVERTTYVPTGTPTHSHGGTVPGVGETYTGTNVSGSNPITGRR